MADDVGDVGDEPKSISAATEAADNERDRLTANTKRTINKKLDKRRTTNYTHQTEKTRLR